MIERLAFVHWQSDWPYILGALLGGYLLGSIPFGLIFAWLAGAGDVRNIGSGNIGATNVLRTGNKWAAAATLVCDALKGAVAVMVARYYLSLEVFYLLAGLGAFVGHVFPVWLGFKGGKGVATFLGIVFALSWPTDGAWPGTLPVGIMACLSWLIVARAFRISSLAALAAAAATPLYFLLLGSSLFAVFAALLAVLIFWTHRGNIARLLRGAEPRIGAR